MPQSYYKPQRQILKTDLKKTKIKYILECYCSLLQFISNHEELALVFKAFLTC